jgi:DNA-binding NarL/FixJ family response regulator
MLIHESVIEALEEMAPITVVGFADSQPACVDWLRQNPESCDLLLIGIQLKLGSGFGVLREATALGRPIASVVLINHASEPMREHCTRLGAHRVFDKSNEFEPFLEYCVQLANRETGPGTLSGAAI